MGNRLSAADVSGGWLYNESNELLQAGNRAEYRYDAAGNLVEKKTPERTLLFEYDLDNHLSRVADGNNATVASYGYDFLRRRVWKDVRGVKTFYHYSDSGLVAKMDASGNVRKSYGYRPGSPWGTDPLFMWENGKNYWYLNDHLGTPQMVVAENGGVVWKAQYRVFGKAEVSQDTTVTNNLRFPGQYYDEETGLHYNWNRYYDPESGRYSQTDPVGFEGGDVNIYRYSKNDPVNTMESSGLLSCEGFWKYSGWDRIFNSICVCYWLCVPCNGYVIWSGNERSLPHTYGMMIYTGGEGLESGDRCLFNKPGKYKDCKECAD